jgi:Tfp pilus assembly protein PilO
MKLPNIKNRPLLPIDAAGVAVCIAISLVVYVIAIDPAVQKRALLAQQRRELATQYDKCAKLKTSMTGLESQLAGTQDELNHSRVRLMSADQVNTRIAELTGVFGDCKLEVDDVQIGPGPVETGRIGGLQVDMLPISITGRGGYKQSAMFLHELGKTFPDMGLAKLELWGDPAKPDEPRRFRFEFLWHTVPKTVASAD